MAAMRHRRELVAVALAVAAVLTIFVNALFLQHGPHPAPIFPLHQQVKPEHAAPAVGARRSADASPRGVRSSSPTSSVRWLIADSTTVRPTASGAPGRRTPRAISRRPRA